jgi:hypothetical protein
LSSDANECKPLTAGLLKGYHGGVGNRGHLALAFAQDVGHLAWVDPAAAPAPAPAPTTTNGTAVSGASKIAVAAAAAVAVQMLFLLS